MLQTGIAQLEHYANKIQTKLSPKSFLPKLNCTQGDGFLERLGKLEKNFSLSKTETYFLFLAMLQELSHDMRELFALYSKNSEGLSLPLAGDIYKQNFGEDLNFRLDFLHDFFFTEKPHAFQLKAHVVRYLHGLSGHSPCTTIGEHGYDEKLHQLKDREGHFLFLGGDEEGKLLLFSHIAKEKKRLAMVISGEKNLASIAFYAVAEEALLCLTDPSLYPQVKAYLPYVSFFALLKEKGGEDMLHPVAFPLPSFTESQKIWEEMAEKFSANIDAMTLASQYHFSRQEILSLMKSAQTYRDLAGDDKINMRHLTNAICQKLLPSELDLGSFQEGKDRLDKVILPQKQKEKLKEALAQVFHRHKVFKDYGLEETLNYGKGLSLLFVGPAGTGKTMCAYAFAKELSALIYRVDLSTVVSKFIGETEKNLRLAFAQAKASQAILFFDEADALFSKRTEVKEAADKYSNMEAAFLLQEIEQYEGITILSTNLLQNIDESFKRRMKFVIEFPLPGAKERLGILKAALPKNLPLSPDIDLDFLAKNFSLSGGNIKNIIYNAAFLAAEKDMLTMRELLLSLMGEYEKMGKTLTAGDMGFYRELMES